MFLKKFIRSNLLAILTFGSVVVGIVIGAIVRATHGKFTEREVMYTNYPGELFLRMLKCLILPLIISSLISAVGSLDLSLSRKIGSRAIIYYMATTVLAVILGIILVVSIRPGDRGSHEDANDQPRQTRQSTTADTFLDLIRNMFPPNLVQACTEQYQTVLKPTTEHPDESDINDWSISSEYTHSMNILGLVVASIATGIAMSATKGETQSVLIFFKELAIISMKITGWVIWLSPVGVLFLILAKIMEMDDPSELFGMLGLYFATVLCGILFHGFVVLPLIYFLITRKNPYIYIKTMGQVMATAFATSSSSATLPLTIQCLEEKNGIDPRITRFVLPIGATINMDGTALYEAVAAIFIAQVRHISLSFGQIIAISITATAASIGAAGIPQAGLVTMVMVLDTVGLPAEDVSLILAVDWLLDRFRTVVNVLGDSFGAGLIQHTSETELKTLDEKPANGSTVSSSCDTLVISD